MRPEYLGQEDVFGVGVQSFSFGLAMQELDVTTKTATATCYPMP